MGGSSYNSNYKRVFIVYGEPGIEAIKRFKRAVIVSSSYERLEEIKKKLDKSLILYGKKRICLKGHGDCDNCIYKPKSKRDFAKLTRHAERYLRGETSNDLCPFHLQVKAMRKADYVLTTPTLIEFVGNADGVRTRFDKLIIDASASDLFFLSSRKLKSFREVGSNEWVEESVVENVKKIRFWIDTLDDAVLLFKLLFTVCEEDPNRLPKVVIERVRLEDIEVVELIRKTVEDPYRMYKYLHEYHQFLDRKINYGNCNFQNLVNAVLLVGYTRAVEGVKLFHELDESLKKEIAEKIGQMEVGKEVIELSKAILFSLGVLEYESRLSKKRRIWLIADEWCPIYKVPEHFSEIYIFTNPFSDKAHRLAECITEEGAKLDFKSVAKQNNFKIIIQFSLIETESLVHLLRRLEREDLRTTVFTPSKEDQIKLMNVLDSYRVRCVASRGIDVRDSSICISLPEHRSCSDIVVIPPLKFIDPFYMFMLYFAEKGRYRKAMRFFERMITYSYFELLLKMSGANVIITDTNQAMKLASALEAVGCRVVLLEARNVDSLVETVKMLKNLKEEGRKIQLDLSCNYINTVTNNIAIIENCNSASFEISAETFSSKVEHYLQLVEKGTKLEYLESKNKDDEVFISEKIRFNRALIVSIFGNSKVLSRSAFIERLRRRLKIKKKPLINNVIKILIDSGQIRKFKRGRKMYYELINGTKSESSVSKTEESKDFKSEKKSVDFASENQVDVSDNIKKSETKSFRCHCGKTFKSEEEFVKHASRCEIFQAEQDKEAKKLNEE